MQIEIKVLMPIFINAFPVCIAVGLSATIGLVDVHLSGSLGEAVQAGVGIADQILFFAALTGAGIAQATASLVARATGERDHTKAEVYANAGLVLSIILGLVSSLLTFAFAVALMAYLSTDPQANEAGSTYLRLCSLANAPYCILLTQSAILRAKGKCVATILPWFVAAVVSIGLSISLPHIIQNGHKLTIECIATGWNLGAILASAVGYFQLKQTGFAGQSITTFHKNKNALGEISALALPISATDAAWLGSNFLMYAILARMPDANDAQAAWTIRLKFEEIAATPVLLAMTMTTAALVGKLTGEKNFVKAKSMTQNASILAATIMFCIGLLVLTFNAPIADFYAVTQTSNCYARIFLCSSIIVFPISAIYLTAFGALEGAGSAFKPMLAILVGLFIIRIPLTLFLTTEMQTEMLGVVTAVIISHCAVALIAVSLTKEFFGSKAIARSSKSPNCVKPLRLPFDKQKLAQSSQAIFTAID